MPSGSPSGVTAGGATPVGHAPGGGGNSGRGAPGADVVKNLEQIKVLNRTNEVRWGEQGRVQWGVRWGLTVERV